MGYYVGMAGSKYADQKIDDEIAVEFALDECGLKVIDPEAEFCKQVCKDTAEWFFSGAWVHKEDEEVEM